jgi:hypothetical protein
MLTKVPRLIESICRHVQGLGLRVLSNQVVIAVGQCLPHLHCVAANVRGAAIVSVWSANFMATFTPSLNTIRVYAVPGL